jgi:cytoskeletal protein CcmA (bactofilin family)
MMRAGLEPPRGQNMSKNPFPLHFVRGLGALLILGGWVGLAQLTPTQAQAQTTAPQTSPAASSPVNRNVYAAGAHVRPAASVDGDYVAAGARIIVDQPVKGDATLAGASVDVRSPVSDDVRAAAGDLSIDSTIGGELFATGGNITLGKVASVARGARLYGGNVTIDGTVDGPLRVGAQRVVINGEVRGDARLAAAQIELGPTARITGALTYAAGAELKKPEGATIGGPVTREERTFEQGGSRAGRERHSPMGGGPFWVGSIVMFLALLACAAVFLLVFPVFAIRASETVEDSPWLSLAMGFGSIFAVPMLAALLFITLVGIPLGVAVIALYPVLLLTGYVVGVFFVARLLQEAMHKETPASFARTVAFFALALLLVMLIGWIPFLGGLAIAAITVAGIGACVIELYRRRQATRASVPAASTATPT